MDLVIDFGTSYGKIGIFENNNLILKNTKASLKDIGSFVAKYTISNVVVSSVSTNTNDIVKKLKVSGKVIILGSTTNIPIKIDYDTPETLGSDRIAAVVGASKLFPNKDVLVIDAGTCITYDLLTSQGVYKGGGISPGMELKFKALHNYTKSLPLMNRRDRANLTGKSTGKSILSGVINGTIAEMNEISRMYRNKFPHLQLVICGGDADYYSSHLKKDFQLAPDLVLIGLKTILDNNV